MLNLFNRSIDLIVRCCLGNLILKYGHHTRGSVFPVTPYDLSFTGIIQNDQE